MFHCEFRRNFAMANGGAAFFEETPLNTIREIGDSLLCGNMSNHVIGEFDDLGGNQFVSDCPSGCFAPDLNCDSIVNVVDLLELLGQWGMCDDCDRCTSDIDADCLIGTAELLHILASWSGTTS